MTEEWRPVRGYEGAYEVSSMGRVRSLDRIDSAGRRLRGVLLRQQVNHTGHMALALSQDGHERTVAVHRLVAEAFLGPRPEGKEVCHWNDSPSDNRVENLRYDTRAANKRDAVRNGIHHLANKTACPLGHPYSGSNLIRSTEGARRCRACVSGQDFARRHGVPFAREIADDFFHDPRPHNKLRKRKLLGSGI